MIKLRQEVLWENRNQACPVIPESSTPCHFRIQNTPSFRRKPESRNYNKAFELLEASAALEKIKPWILTAWEGGNAVGLSGTILAGFRRNDEQSLQGGHCPLSGFLLFHWWAMPTLHSLSTKNISILLCVDGLFAVQSCAYEFKTINPGCFHFSGKYVLGGCSLSPMAQR